MKNFLSLIAGGKSTDSAPRKDTVTCCSYIDRNGRKAFFCEAQKYTIIFVFFSKTFNQYATVTLNTNKRFNRLNEKDIPSEWEKTFYDECDIGPEKYGRCFLTNTFTEAVQKSFYILHKLLYGMPEIMPEPERVLCVQCSLPSLFDRTQAVLEAKD